MLYQNTVLLIALAVALALPAAAQQDDLDALGWLAGCWQGEGGGGANLECWTTPEGGLMLGVSRVISEKSTQFEFLRIARHGDGLALLASPGGKPVVAFPLVDRADGLAVFANPEHDFPQRITYRRDGEEMTARVEAERDGEWGGFDIAWQRTSGSWPGRPQSHGPQPSHADPQPSHEELQQQVRDAETAFAQTMADRDHAAFSAFLSEEAIFFSAATTRGRDQVAAQWKGFFEGPQAPFSWQPETVEVLDSGTLALSSGPVHDRDGKLIATYNSIWRQEAPGEWRVVFDKGSPVCGE